MSYRSQLSYLAYRYRYAIGFTVIGFLSILAEIAFIKILPSSWNWLTKAISGFLIGMSLSFVLNTFVNFKVPRSYLLRTFAWFVAISTLSFMLNMVAVHISQSALGAKNYAIYRLISSGALFVIAYTLHRRFTFDQAREIGLAIYANEGESVEEVFQLVGLNCDHIHVDLIDETMGNDPSPVRLSRIAEIRRLWHGLPVCLHLMSLEPSRWVPLVSGDVDWLVFHVNGEDLMPWLYYCRQRSKQIGVAWHESVSPSALMPYLPHVDFVLILGVKEPGVSGQPMNPQALEVAATFNRMRANYRYDLIFDGGVNTKNISQVPAKYVVVASGVRVADDPVRASHVIRTGGLLER